ncbi:Gfo/Idh/MocA family protein [Paenibacillus sp. 1001270B_150601_E10]|uniref:Gfo/Idh/MocA family protein n=1 Tax=Paenibacillus sp. 1001270B_150601_E10 TaxID=2787079 RepID=UPI00189E2E02|nr:Gfo/Idh/MocA family oxidoreductase [Paenibacillus sp. 1001270B_150601_E10]
MSAIRIAIIGAGQIGKHHLTQYQQVSGIEVAAICDIRGDEAARVAAQFGVPDTYTDFREVLKRDDIVAVDVCLHNNFHAPVTIEALKAGKHVYCEKPMAGSYRDAHAMLEVAKETGRMLHIQLGTLFTVETRAAKTLIDEGKLGKLYHARSTGYRRRGRPYVDGYGTPSFTRKADASGGALYDMGVYHISQLLYLMGMPAPLRVSGETYQEMAMLENRREISQFDVEELGVGFVKLAGGITLDIIEAWSVHMDAFEGSSLMGSEGGIRLPRMKNGHALTYHFTCSDMDMDATIDLHSAHNRYHLLNDWAWAYDSPEKHWAAVLQDLVPLMPTAKLALDTMLISEGIYQSSKLGREMTADEILELSVSSAVKL